MPRGPIAGKVRSDIPFGWGKQGRDFELTNPVTEPLQSVMQAIRIEACVGSIGMFEEPDERIVHVRIWRDVQSRVLYE